MLLQHSFGILFNEMDTWKQIKEKDTNPLLVMMGYVAVMAAIGPLAAYYGTTQVGWTISGTTHFLSPSVAFQLCLLTYLAIIGGIFEQEFAKDVLEVLTVFSAKLYGSRSRIHHKA